MNIKYSGSDLVVLNSNFSNSVVARLLGRSVASVRQKKHCLKHPDKVMKNTGVSNHRRGLRNEESLKTADEHGQRWSDTDNAYIISTAGRPLAEVAAALGRSVNAISSRRCVLANA